MAELSARMKSDLDLVVKGHCDLHRAKCDLSLGDLQSALRGDITQLSDELKQEIRVLSEGHRSLNDVVINLEWKHRETARVSTDHCAGLDQPQEHFQLNGLEEQIWRDIQAALATQDANTDERINGVVSLVDEEQKQLRMRCPSCPGSISVRRRA